MPKMKEYQLNVDPRILELLGPNLYTNIYYVLAELVANAYDADAHNVYIISNRDDIRIEDDGHGMSYENGEVRKFLNVAGVSRSNEAESMTRSGERRKMGRKGVGKLAALSVSESVNVMTVSNNEKSGFVLSRKPIDGNKLQPIPDENAHPEKLDTAPKLPPFVGPRFSHFVLVLGVGGLLFVPIFKAVTGLPPYLGMLISLGVLWVFTELVYDHKQNMEESIKNRVSKVLKHIDMPTILFFLGILMSVAALQSAGLLTDFADFLDKNVHEVYTIAGITGLLSAVIDNVPLVAACMGMYPVVDTAALASSLDPVYMQAFVQDGIFWHLLTFCAGVGGSLLIIGSAAGVVAMGLEKIEFGWYLRKITLLALAGYFAGMLVIFLEHLLLG